jgi:hypothetical protein
MRPLHAVTPRIATGLRGVIASLTSVDGGNREVEVIAQDRL